MKEIKSILNLYHSQKGSSEKAAIAQVVRVEESSYRREGARMLVFASGIFEGGISGGCLEGDALQRSQIAILKQEPSIVTYDTSKDDENQIGVGLGCNGIIDVLISPISEHTNVIPILEKCVAKRKAHIIVTVTAIEGTVETMGLGTMFYYDTELQQLENCQHNGLENFIKAKVPIILERKRSAMYNYREEGLNIQVLIELVPPQFHLAIYGDNYDVYAMLALAQVLDWEVSIVGNLQKLKKEKLRTVKGLYLKDSDKRPLLDNRTAVVLMAHDFKTDIFHLKQVIQSDAPYIASLGPRKRYIKILNNLAEDGITLSAAQEDRIFAPCGLEIGANSPEEIAASIIAEILSVFSGNTGGMLRKKEGPIHERD